MTTFTDYLSFPLRDTAIVVTSSPPIHLIFKILILMATPFQYLLYSVLQSLNIPMLLVFLYLQYRYLHIRFT